MSLAHPERLYFVAMGGLLLATACLALTAAHGCSGPRPTDPAPRAEDAPRATPGEKKEGEPKKLGDKKETKMVDEPQTFQDGDTIYNEKVTVRVWIAAQKVYLNPKPNQWAVRRLAKNGDLIFSLCRRSGFDEPTKGSIIIDAAGNEYEVTVASAAHANTVKLIKPAEKP